MAATNHTPDSITSIAAGKLITWFTPTATVGDMFSNTSGTVMVLVKNGSADTDTTVLIDCPTLCSRGYNHDVSILVEHGTTWGSSVLPVAMFANPTDGKTTIICSAITDVQMALIQMTLTPAA